MIASNEKKFWFHNLCYEVMHRHDQAFYDPSEPTKKLSVDHLDTSRIADFKCSFAKLVGLCIPYKYEPHADFAAGIITIRSYVNNRIYLTYKRGMHQIDVD